MLCDCGKNFVSEKEPTSEEKMLNMARRLFSTGNGPKVLTHLITRMFFFNSTETPQQMVVKNFATDYMTELGFHTSNAEIIVETILKLPRSKEKE